MGVRSKRVLAGNRFLLIFLCAIILFLSYFVLADLLTTLPSSFSYNESFVGTYNITINNTNPIDGAGINFTQVNITFPSGFLIYNDTNGTNALGSLVVMGQTLVWTNSTMLVQNGTANFFWINASSSTPGVYNISIVVLGTGDATNTTNISVKINDTTLPVISLISPIEGNNTINAGSLQFIFNVTDSLSTNCSLILNGVKVNFNSSVNRTGGNNIFTNVTGYGLSNTWSVNCTDSDNNKANSSTYNFYLKSFNLIGTTYDESGNRLNNTNVSVILKNSTFSDVATYSTMANASGWFNLSLYNNSAHMYTLTLIQRNSSASFVEWVGQSLPSFPYAEFSLLSNTSFYLKQAGTINVTVRNNTNSLTPNFAVQIKDIKLGYPVTCSGQSGNDYICYVPKNRNYSIMVYPSSGGGEQFVPVSFNWNNFSSTSPYNLSSTNLSNYNFATLTIHKQFNVTQSFARITGYLLNSTGGDFADWVNFTVVPFLLEPGNMIFMTYGTLPWNVSAWNGGETDSYNLTTGFYNLSLPYSATETISYLLYAAGQNSTFYGSYKNITVSGSVNAFNFTMYPLLGSEAIINMTDASGGANHIVYTKRQSFNLVNSSNLTLEQASAHIELDVDYSSVITTLTPFTFMEDLNGQSSATFSFPLLNVSGLGFKEMNVYSQTYSPKRVSTRTAAQIIANPNITLASFNPEGIGSTLNSSILNISAYRSNSTCDVPNPPSACVLASFTEEEAQNNMFGLVIGGGAISLRMSYGNVSVHYANVDLLASGPPEADFENNVGTNEGSDSFANAAKFGSQGPTIYDYVLIAMPYTEGSTSQTGLDENSQVNLTIPSFYDEDYTAAIWTSSNGTTASALAGNYSHYSTYQSDWQILMNTNNTCFVTTSGTSTINSSTPCHIQTADNKIWIRLPHFSGIEPSASGSLINAASATTGSTGGSSYAPVWTMTYILPETQKISEGYTQKIKIKERIKVNISGEYHYIGVLNLTLTQATIIVSSTPQEAVFNVGDEKKFDISNDNYYDVSVTLNSIEDNLADITIKSIYELKPANEIVGGDESEGETDEGSEKSILNNWWFWLIIVIVVIVVVIVILIIRGHNTKKH